MNHLESIDKGLAERKSHVEIVRKVYLTYPTKAFIENEERQYDILNEISLFFDIPINHIQVCGSSKVGRSFHKTSTFKPKISDLDIAIIDPSLFTQYSEIVFKLSEGFQNLTKFSSSKGNSFANYSSYISKGIFRPDFMPSCQQRAAWFKFFSELSLKHNDYFKSINAGIYQSQTFFEFKQVKNIKDYIKI
ncbi:MULTISPECIES: hypothetical protein [Sphingobacterium]|uniref:hypothetical protein n=1 Tax=Sphingobacterium TaxID=28453 RepID=UPI0013DD5022|nr:MULTISPECIES: hypothetical protein [unclassified Sphingobacterium]